MAELAGFARVVERVSAWENLGGLGFHKFQGFVEWAYGNAADFDGVHLLKARERAGFRAIAKCGDGAEGDKFFTQTANLKVEDLLLVEAIGATDLGDHFIAAAVDIESVHEVSADRGRNIGSDFGKV